MRGKHYSGIYPFKIFSWWADDGLKMRINAYQEMTMSEKILVIDEQEASRCCLSEILVGAGYAVITASDMTDGLRLLQVEEPDLVIADIKQPIGDCLKKLHDNNELESYADLILLAGEEERSAVFNWLDKGAYDWLQKPVIPPLGLLAAVRRALQKRHLVFENIRLAKELDRVTIKDPLTGVYNSRHMYKCLMDEIVRSTRYNRRFLLIIADIDRFRWFNEAYGRYAGDLVLTRLARLFEENLRLADVIFRYDEGKFLFLLPETQISQAIRVAERLLEGVRYHAFDCNGSNPRVTISMGASEFPSEARDVPSLMELAGLRLDSAKQAGGDGFQFENHPCRCDSIETL
jgi:two-component system cell cycle response regulator